ncbi:response regulator transcription factor [Glaciecola sp. XM2]|uniref:response regulator n=1 Tax=Glaciecola sp. XM2 TaxID=1914931 RepID=UPI0020331893|nr:response regulator transcription factor [Glaciecola sp. XM2]
MNPFMPDLYQALIADDHPLFRNALHQVLSEQLNMVVTQSHNFEQTIEALKHTPDIDLVFLDLNMPDTEGLSGLTRLRAEHPNILIIIVSADEDPVTISKCIHLGASAFIPKSESLESISDAVHTVLDGEQWLPPDFVLSNTDNVEIENFQRLETLTPHQLKVLNMIANGLLNKQIAYELDISESTVKQHASAVLRKLGVNNRTLAGIMYKQLMSIE